MPQFIARRLVLAMVSVLGATLILFVLSRTQADPRYTILGQPGYTITEEMWEAMGKELGLDRSYPVQFLIYVKNVLTGDWGESLISRAPVIDRIKERVPQTIKLGAVAYAVSTLIGIPLGILSAVQRGTVWDYIGRSIALFGQATPTFWIAIVMMWILAVQLDLLPSSGRGTWQHMVMPTIALSLGPLAGYTRLTRSAMLDVLDSEYIKMARAKGLGATTVIWKHAFKNALIGPLTFSGLLFAGLINGSAIVEFVFAYAGLGALSVDATRENDFVLMSSIVIVFTILYVVISFVVDMIYLLVDPRIKYT